MHFSRDSCVSSVLESSCMPYTLRFSVRGFLALTRKLLFLDVPLNKKILIVHIGFQNFRNFNSTIGLLVVFQNGNQCAAYGQS